MATCKDASPLAIDWLESRSRWLIPLIGSVVVVALVGFLAVASDWFERVIWLAAGAAGVSAVISIYLWRYRRFLVATDQAWIGDLRSGSRTADFHQQRCEMQARLRAGWRRGRTALPDAVHACIAWIEVHRAEIHPAHHRELVFLMCRAIQGNAAGTNENALRACMSAMRLMLLDLDRGQIDGRHFPDHARWVREPVSHDPSRDRPKGSI